MGTWGPGNFENDGAGDHLADLTHGLLADVRRYMAHRKLLEPDEPEAEIVPCNLEILTLLASQNWAGVALPTATEVKAWKLTFMEVWDGYIDSLNPKLDYRIARRAVLTNTFEQLIALLEIREASNKQQ